MLLCHITDKASFRHVYVKITFACRFFLYILFTSVIIWMILIGILDLLSVTSPNIIVEFETFVMQMSRCYIHMEKLLIFLLPALTPYFSSLVHLLTCKFHKTTQTNFKFFGYTSYLWINTLIHQFSFNNNIITRIFFVFWNNIKDKLRREI